MRHSRHTHDVQQSNVRLQPCAEQLPFSLARRPATTPGVGLRSGDLRVTRKMGSKLFPLIVSLCFPCIYGIKLVMIITLTTCCAIFEFIIFRSRSYCHIASYRHFVQSFDLPVIRGVLSITVSLQANSLLKLQTHVLATTHLKERTGLCSGM